MSGAALGRRAGLLISCFSPYAPLNFCEPEFNATTCMGDAEKPQGEILLSPTETIVCHGRDDM